MKRDFTVAIAGNPNCGKSGLFNCLTGSRQHIGNYPGVTVEKKEGSLVIDDLTIKVIDLPGLYSLTANSIEEIIARDVLINEKIDLIINVVDSSNLERHLFFTTELLALNIPILLLLNMRDISLRNGLSFDYKRLSTALNVETAESIVHKGIGIDSLKKQIYQFFNKDESLDAPKMPSIISSHRLQEFITNISNQLVNLNVEPLIHVAKWKALKLLEKDRLVQEELAVSSSYRKNISEPVDENLKNIETTFGNSTESLVASERYKFVNKICSETVSSSKEATINYSEKIDLLLTNKIVGLPIFFLLMYLVFNLTFTLGEPMMNLFENGFSYLGKLVSSFWEEGSPSIIRSLLVDGIIAGVGGVLVFLPNIILLFLAISFLEASGYMSRAVFIMDKLMSKFGLQGKSFIPLLTGFGCSVPAIMATRSLDSNKDRLITIMIIPLMSCSARLPIYLMIIPAFFHESAYANVMWLIYVIGIVLAIASAWVLRHTLFKGESTPFILEMPPYRLPTLKSIVIEVIEKGKFYIKRAGTIILAVSILLWAAAAFPEKQEFDKDYDKLILDVTLSDSISDDDKQTSLIAIEHDRQAEKLAYTVMGRIGPAIEPILAPLGFDWRIGTALVGAFAAKEVFVAQLGIVFSLGGEATEESLTLREKLRSNYTPLQGFCVMLFCLISTPCIATLAVTKKESGSSKWAIAQFLGLTLLGYIVTLIVYQSGLFLNIGV
ncbi:MAG: ferrous iron transport protein B [Nitrospinota bacterium]